jgi:hypothetical protein
MKLSNGQDRPDWIAYDTGNGKMTVKRADITESVMLQLKVEVKD